MFIFKEFLLIAVLFCYVVVVFIGIFYPVLGLSEQSNCINGLFLLYTVTAHDIVFLVPDSCWTMVEKKRQQYQLSSL